MTFLPLLLALTACTAATKAPQSVQPYDSVPVQITTPVAPIPVRGDDGRWWLAYTVFLTSWCHSELVLREVEVLDEARAVALVRYGATELEDIQRFNAYLPTPEVVRIQSRAELRRLPSGRMAALHVWLAVESEDDLPTELVHRFVFEPSPLVKLLVERTPATDAPLVIDAVPLRVRREAPIVLGPPLSGGPWRCLGVTYDHPHQYIACTDGRVSVSQRFAIDFSLLDESGDVLPSPFPDDIDNGMFYGYGADVLAVADAVVAYVLEGVPENDPLPSGATNAPVPLTRETWPGNQVRLDLGGGRYAIYAHLATGSVQVKPGGRVRRGQVLGRLGNTGNSAGPHLHFQVCDANAVMASEGLPFVFESFVLDWRTQTSKGRPKGLEPEVHVAELPLDGSVVTFP